MLFTLPRACSLLQLSWWNWSGFMLELLLLPLTVIAKANGGLLPTHQAPVGGDVCPLRVCSEAEDKRRGTATLSALAVPHIARLHSAHLMPGGSGQLGTPTHHRLGFSSYF